MKNDLVLNFTDICAGKCTLDKPVVKEHYHHIQLHQVDKSAIVEHVTDVGPKIMLKHHQPQIGSSGKRYRLNCTPT